MLKFGTGRSGIWGWGCDCGCWSGVMCDDEVLISDGAKASRLACAKVVVWLFVSVTGPLTS